MNSFRAVVPSVDLELLDEQMSLLGNLIERETEGGGRRDLLEGVYELLLCVFEQRPKGGA